MFYWPPEATVALNLNPFQLLGARALISNFMAADRRHLSAPFKPTHLAGSFCLAVIALITEGEM